jgi:hypothetical protein
VKLALYASHPHTLRCMPPGQKHAYLALHPTDNRPCENRPQFTVASGFHGCTLLRAARLSGFPRTRPHPCVVASHHILHTRPPDASHVHLQNSLVTFHCCLELRSSPSV